MSDKHKLLIFKAHTTKPVETTIGDLVSVTALGLVVVILAVCLFS